VRRKRLRLSKYDYAQAGAYFVTVCTRERACLFGEVASEEIRPNAIGRIVAVCWNDIPRHNPGVDVDALTIMPNHIHGILFLGVGAGYIRPLPSVMATFKAAASRRTGQALWQRSYHERVIRNDDELRALREYIATNPRRWALDRENPTRRPRSNA